MSTTSETHQRAIVPPNVLDTPYPLIDSDPHIKRVLGYSRPSDWAVFAGITAFPPVAMELWERWQPSYVGRGAFPPMFRLSLAVGLTGGFFFVTQTSSLRFYGVKENKREQEMDMREMVDKVKRGEPLYGTSKLSPYMQGVASRNSRYSGILLHVIPWFNFVNHNQHGVDTAKYYQQAERELEAEGQSS